MLTVQTRHLAAVTLTTLTAVIFLSAYEASESCSYDVTAGAHRRPDRNHLLQSAWALRDPQGVLRRTFAPRPAVEPPPEGRGPLPETGEEKGGDKWQGSGWFGLVSVCASDSRNVSGCNCPTLPLIRVTTLGTQKGLTVSERTFRVPQLRFLTLCTPTQSKSAVQEWHCSQ